MADDNAPDSAVTAFVPDDFTPPTPPRTAQFWLEPLGPEHNEADYAAWTSSIEHIHATPGFPDGSWPEPMSLESNLADLVMHADHFDRRVGFTYTVRSASDDDVVGCLYIYPSKDDRYDAEVKSWVRQSHADLDVELWHTVSQWLRDSWPCFDAGRIDYAPRPTPPRNM